jgi:cell division protein ZapB
MPGESRGFAALTVAGAAHVAGTGASRFVVHGSRLTRTQGFAFGHRNARSLSGRRPPRTAICTPGLNYNHGFTFNNVFNALTQLGICHTIRNMTEFENLEQKIAQLVSLHKQIKEENRDLRLRATQLETENKTLDDKMAAARERLATLVARLPDAAEEN